MIEKEMFEIAKKDFASVGIKLDSMESIFIPGFYPDAIGDYHGRNVVVEFKVSEKTPIRNLIVHVVNQYRKGREFIGRDGFVFLAVANGSKLDYYNITSLVLGNKTNVKSDLDKLTSSSKELDKSVFKDKDNSSLKIGKIAEFKETKKNSLRFDLFKIAGIGLAAILLVAIGVLDALEIYELSYERLILVGILVFILILPVIKSISINGYGFETNSLVKDKADKADK